MKNQKSKRENLGGRLLKMAGRESGFALPVALAVLLVITFLGISAITFTNLGVDVSRNVRNGESAFYTADNCLVLARGVLQTTHHNDANAWNTSLTGHGNAGDQALTTGVDYDNFTGMVITTQKGMILYNDLNQPINDYNIGTGFCTVWVRNNAEDLKLGHITDDTDHIIVVTALGKSSLNAGAGQAMVEAAINWKVNTKTDTALESREITDYPQLTMGPQNLNSAEASLDVLGP